MLEEGAQIIADREPADRPAALGHVTSAYEARRSAARSRWRWSRGARAHRRDALRADAWRRHPRDRTSPIFYERPGARLHVLTLRSRARSPLEGLAAPRRGRDSPCPRRRRRRVSSCATARLRASHAGSSSAPSRRRVGPAGEGAGRAASMARARRMAVDCGRRRRRSAQRIDRSWCSTGPPTAWLTSRIARSALSRADPAAARALNAGCPLDLSLKAFPVGMATPTIFDKAETVLWRRAATTFHVEVWRSFAPDLVRLPRRSRAWRAGVVNPSAIKERRKGPMNLEPDQVQRRTRPVRAAADRLH